MKNLKKIILLIVGICFSVLFCVYFFNKVDVAVYRVVVIFLALILISNLTARFLFTYFKNK